jgi:hypothetical protein
MNMYVSGNSTTQGYITFLLKIYSSLKTKADLAEGGLTAGSASNLNISAKIRIYIQNNFRV